MTIDPKAVREALAQKPECPHPDDKVRDTGEKAWCKDCGADVPVIEGPREETGFSIDPEQWDRALRGPSFVAKRRMPIGEFEETYGALETTDEPPEEIWHKWPGHGEGLAITLDEFAERHVNPAMDEMDRKIAHEAELERAVNFILNLNRRHADAHEPLVWDNPEPTSQEGK